MALATIVQHYLERYKTRYGHCTTADQRSALNAILGCRTGPYGEVLLACSECAQQDRCHQSCGHRSCNRCQNHCTTQWLERQKAKLLPVDYFMATFPLPRQLRPLAQRHPKVIYALLFQCATSVLTDFARRKKHFGAELALTAVRHTHTRRLDYHPHVHIVVPGGGVHRQRREWRTVKGRYLFNGFQLAGVFRGRLLAAIRQAGLQPPQTPHKWVVQCQRIGRGLPALAYLSRYLYRGVISDRNIWSDDGTYVTFRYKDSATNRLETRGKRGEDFVHLVLQHVLPKGFRRVRDYGFLHGKAKRLLRLVQWVLRVSLPEQRPAVRPRFICQCCGHVMNVVGFVRMKPG